MCPIPIILRGSKRGVRAHRGIWFFLSLLMAKCRVIISKTNLNYKMKYYDATLESLEILKPLVFGNSDYTSSNVLYTLLK